MRAVMTAVLAAGLIVSGLTGVAAADDGDAMFPHVVAVGDLNGDGADDVVTRTEASTMTDLIVASVGQRAVLLTARSGRNGSALWEFTTELPLVEIVSARVGAAADPGVLLVERDTAGTSGGSGCSTSVSGMCGIPTNQATASGAIVTALQGDGTTAWSHTFERGLLLDVVMREDTRFTIADAHPRDAFTLQANDSPATDVLVSVATAQHTPAGANGGVTVMVLDGADGTPSAERTLDAADGQWRTAPTEDVDGDGRDDVIAWTGTRFAALRGTDLSPLWTTEGLDLPGIVVIRSVGDVTGDGIADVGVSAQEFFVGQSESIVLGLDGASGSVILPRRNGIGVFEHGDVDRDGAADMLVIDSAVRVNDTVVVGYDIHDGSGQILVTEEYAHPTGPSGIVYLRRGDVQGDGVNDLIWEGRENQTVTGGGVLDGRSMQPIWTGAAAGDVPINRGGPGSDVVSVTFDGTDARVTTRAGASGVDRWSTLLPHGGEGFLVHAAQAADVTGDGVEDVLLTVRSTATPENPVVGGSSFTESSTVVTKGYVVDGRDGALLWGSGD